MRVKEDGVTESEVNRVTQKATWIRQVNACELAWNNLKGH